MDFTKLQTEIAALTSSIKKSEEPPPKSPEAKQMSKDEFAAYATDQIGKAKVEADAGKPELAKKRLTALHTEVERIAKYEFFAKELPTITVYKDPEQLDTTEADFSVKDNVPGGGNSWTAKATELAKQLSEAIGDLSNRPTDKQSKPEEKPAEVVEDDTVWPEDIASDMRKSHRTGDKDYDWGRDRVA